MRPLCLKTFPVCAHDFNGYFRIGRSEFKIIDIAGISIVFTEIGFLGCAKVIQFGYHSVLISPVSIGNEIRDCNGREDA